MSEQKDWVKTFLQLPLPFKVAIGAVVLIVILVSMANRPNNPTERKDEDRGGDQVPAADADGYLFCFWNLENLFDDVDDEKRRPPDERYNREFAQDVNLRATKLGNLSKVLLSMNGGKGPDILAVAELESDRALELLQDRLNSDLGERAAKYVHRLFREQKSGRHIAPGILTRLPVDGNKTRQLGEHYHRILEGHIRVNDRQLVVVVSHWTSRVQRPGGGHDESKNEEQRKKYADVIYGRFKAMYLANPRISFTVSGDFNDDPTDSSVVDHLRGTGDRTRLTSGDEPMLFNLAANRDLEKFGTLSHHNRWNLFDQILVSPAMLNDGDWTCDPTTFRTVREFSQNRRGRPWSFDEDDEGHRF